MIEPTEGDYLVPDGIALPEIEERLQAATRFLEEPAHTVTRTFFDSFDWGVYQAGAALEERRDERGRLLVWRAFEDGDAGPSAEIREETEAQIGFARDLPAGVLRDRAAAAVGIRRLLPLLEVESRVRVLRLLNEDDKTVVRLVLEESRFRDGRSGRGVALSSRLRLCPVRGYEDELSGAAGLLEQVLGLEPARTPLLLEALAAAGRRPGDYSSKVAFRLDPERRADASTKEILRGLLDTLEANVEGTLANLDPEFLHDLRVATRRSRSALAQIKGVFPAEVVDDFKGRLAWLQGVTGPVRDMDVYLLDFEGYRDSLPAPLRPHLEALREFLQAHYAQAHAAMAAALRSARFADLLRDWRAFLQSPVPERSALPNAMRPTKAVADERIWRAARRVLREGNAITAASPAEEMHELRKSCKKLRYLMEFFQSLYPKREIGPLIKQLKVLLDNLGGLQDLAVQAGHLRELAERMRAEGRAGTDNLLAMGALVGDLFRRQAAAREEFSRIFAELDSEASRVAYRSLFKPAAAGAKGK